MRGARRWSARSVMVGGSLARLAYASGLGHALADGGYRSHVDAVVRATPSGASAELTTSVVARAKDRSRGCPTAAQPQAAKESPSHRE
jgi:hypothetical protein